jgi:hypothetical protein
VPADPSRSLRLLTASAIALAGVIGCSGDSAHDADPPNPSATRVATSEANGSVDLGGSGYEVVALPATGRVSGRVTFAGAATAPVASDSTRDSAAVTPPAPDTAEVKCASPVHSWRLHRPGKSAPRPTKATSGDPGGQASMAVVWIAGVTKGKPIDEDKRADLASENCSIDPRVMAVAVGTTFDVVNDDKALHTLLFTRTGGRDTLTRMPFFNAGQVVASERIAKVPGIVDVTCIQHPWTHASIAVFAHPYYAVTDASGHFAIDSLPPGNYQLMVWSPGMSKPQRQQITVTPGGDATVSLKR